MDADADQVLAVVHATAAGLTALPQQFADAVLAPPPRSETGSLPSFPPVHSPLTPREAQVLPLLAEGLANKVIAAQRQRDV